VLVSVAAAQSRIVLFLDVSIYLFICWLFVTDITVVHHLPVLIVRHHHSSSAYQEHLSIIIHHLPVVIVRHHLIKRLSIASIHHHPSVAYEQHFFIIIHQALIKRHLFIVIYLPMAIIPSVGRMQKIYFEINLTSDI
jgi:hypothetical protein